MIRAPQRHPAKQAPVRTAALLRREPRSLRRALGRCLSPLGLGLAGLVGLSACGNDPSYQLRWTLVESDVNPDGAVAAPLTSAIDCAKHGLLRVRLDTVYLEGDQKGELADSREFPCYPEAFLTKDDPVVAAEREELRELLGIDENGRRLPADERDDEAEREDEDLDAEQRRAQKRRREERLEFLDNLNGFAQGPALEPGRYRVLLYGLDRTNERWRTLIGPERGPDDACNLNYNPEASAGTEGAEMDGQDEGEPDEAQLVDRADDSSPKTQVQTLCHRLEEITITKNQDEPKSLGELILRAPHQCEDGVDNDNDGASDVYDPGCAEYSGFADDSDAFEQRFVSHRKVLLDLDMFGRDPQASFCNPQSENGESQSFGGAITKMLLTFEPVATDENTSCESLKSATHVLPTTECDTVNHHLVGFPHIYCRHLTCTGLNNNFAAVAPDGGCARATLTGLHINDDTPVTESVADTRVVLPAKPTEFKLAMGFTNISEAYRAAWGNNIILSYEQTLPDLGPDFASTECTNGKTMAAVTRIRIQVRDDHPDPFHGQSLLMAAIGPDAMATASTDPQNPYVEFDCAALTGKLDLSAGGFVWTDHPVRIKVDAAMSSPIHSGDFGCLSTAAPGSIADPMHDLRLGEIEMWPKSGSSQLALNVYRTLDPSGGLVCRECNDDTHCANDASCDFATGRCVPRG